MMTSRHSISSFFSSATARVKARREKFANKDESSSSTSSSVSTRTWAGGDVNRGSGGSGGSGGFDLELPSPTIGGSIPSHLLLLPQAISPLALFTTATTSTTPTTTAESQQLSGVGGDGGDGGGRKLVRKPTMMPSMFNRRRPILKKDTPRLATTTEHPSSPTTPTKTFMTFPTNLTEMSHLSRSLDSTPFWEPFLPDTPTKSVPTPPPPSAAAAATPSSKKRTTQPPSRLDLFQMRNSLDSSAICEDCRAAMVAALAASTTKPLKPIIKTRTLTKQKERLSSSSSPPPSTDISPPPGQVPLRKAATLPSSSGGGGARTYGSGPYVPIDPKMIITLEKRRHFWGRKHTNSAPDRYNTFESGGSGSGWSGGSRSGFTENLLNTTRRLCGNCQGPVTNCLDGVLKATTRKGDTSTITPPSVEVWESEIRTARCGNVAVTHVSELDFPDADPPCHFCCEQASTAIHDESRLQIVSGGLVRSRDGSTRSGSAPYINLPSPNVQTEGGQQAFGSLDLSPSMSQNLLLSPGSHHYHLLSGGSGAGSLPCPHRLSSGMMTSTTLGMIGVGGGVVGGSGGGNTVPSSRGGSIVSSSGNAGCPPEEMPLVGPPASALTIRRPALVPPKLIPDHDYEGDGDKDGRSWGRCSSDDINTSPRNRRSSIVVIPPMQICPGDLLVYGKVLSQRKSLLGTPIESPSPIPTIFDGDSHHNRKGKVTWSLLKLFERSSRSKGGPTGTLEEIMNLLQPCDFSDPKLSRFKGMVWSDFVSHVSNQKTKKSVSVVSSESSSGPSTSSSVNDFKGQQCSSPIPVTTTTIPSSPSAPTAIKVSITAGAMAAVMSSPTKVVNNAPPKPLVRKRMGLMRTMSDRCLERRLTPALFRAQGFLMSEKLVEGKEPDSAGGPSSCSEGVTSSTPPGPPPPGEPILLPLNLPGPSSSPATSRKSSADETDPILRQKLRQKEALWDLFQSECSFLYDHLMVLKNVFMEPLKRIQVEGFAMYAEPELLFGNLDELCAVTYAFCKEFIHLLLTLTDPAGSLPTTQVLAKLFEPSSKARAMSQAYHRYALNYINALNYLETLRRHVEFCDFEKLCMKDPRCKKLQLTDLLVSPVQHLMKIPLILKDIQSRTNEPQEKELIVQILDIQESSIRELDDKMRWLKNFERLLEIQRNIVWPSILEMEPKQTWVPDFLRAALSRQPCDSIIVSPRRQIIHEGLLQLWDTGKASECYVILFDDMLLITRRKKGLSKKKSSLTENWQSACGKSGPVVGGEGTGPNHRYIVYRQPISLDRFFIHDISEGESNSAKLESAFVLVSLNRFQQIIAVHTLQAAAEPIKATWLQKLKATQDKWKRTLQTTVFRGVRSSTDSGQSNVASSILALANNKPFLHRHNTCESSN